MNALDLKFDTDYRVIVKGSHLPKGDTVRRHNGPLDDESSVKFAGSSGATGYLSIGDVEEIIPYDPQINFNTLKTALKSLTTIIPPEVNSAEQLGKWVDALPCESHCGNSNSPQSNTEYQRTQSNMEFFCYYSII